MADAKTTRPRSSNGSSVNVLMVCLGNICRSPTAHAVFQDLIDSEGMAHALHVDSAGTGAWHLGEAPDPRSVRAGAGRGYDLSPLRARQVAAEDFRRFDYILAMDLANLRDLRTRCPPDCHPRLQLLLDYGDGSRRVVPDPYHEGEEGFELVLDLVESACRGLFRHIRQQHFSMPAR